MRPSSTFLLKIENSALIPLSTFITEMNDCYFFQCRLLKSDPAQLFEKLEIQARYVYTVHLLL